MGVKRVLTVTVVGALGMTPVQPVMAQGNERFPTTVALITLKSTGAPDGLPDPEVEVLDADGTTWTPAVAFQHPAYQPIPGTGYVNATGDGSGVSNSTYQYRIAFTLPASHFNATLFGDVFADNAATVSLNSTLIGAQPQQEIVANFQGTPTAFGTSDASLFLTGRNYLYFHVWNASGPTALDFGATLTHAYQCAPGHGYGAVNHTHCGPPGPKADWHG